MKNLWKKSSRSLRLEQLENRELLSATTWETAAQADAAVAAEMAATLSDAAIDLSSILVNSDGDVTDANDGYTTLREAIAAAQDGDTIAFADGITEIKIDAQLYVSKAITIDGGENGVTIDAQGGSRVFMVDGGTEAAPVVLKGLTITGGAVGEYSSGGGLYMDGGYLDVDDSTITGNSATNGNGAAGGGVYIYSGFVAFENVEISKNTSYGVGTRGGDFSAVAINYLPSGAAASFNGCLIVDNESAGRGAIGVLNSGATIEIANFCRRRRGKPPRKPTPP
ncbi:MAG: hypothetical protein IKY61_06955, partial [Thermoguttaceae bacterium]|nr:hypothetical protein [Thermoguttaceae bacterium]